MSSDEDVDDWKSSGDEGDGYEDEDVDEIIPEMGAFDRVAFTGLTGNAPKTRLEKAAQEPLEKFQQSVEAISRDINGDNTIITNENIKKMTETASHLEHVEHKNPSAYILGFLATEGGTVTEKNPDNKAKKLYDKIIKTVLPLIDADASVFPEDVIRYSRLWIQLYSKKQEYNSL
jgi:hypothetical protein